MTPTQKWRESNPDKVRAIRKRYYDNNREKILEANRKYYAENKEKISQRESQTTDRIRERHLKHKYNVSLAEYNDLLVKQNYVCAICATSINKLCVDHDHTTKKVRGILCLTCNSALGKFHDSTEILHKAIAYLNDNK